MSNEDWGWAGERETRKQHQGEAGEIRALRKFTEKYEQRKGGRELGGRASCLERAIGVVGDRGTIVRGGDENLAEIVDIWYTWPSWLEVKIIQFKRFWNFR